VAFCYELMREALGQVKDTETGVTRGRNVQLVWLSLFRFRIKKPYS